MSRPLVAQGVGPGPTIDVWHGLNQSFGQVGQPQRWVNILGTVSDADGVASLTAAVNAGLAFPLTIGSDERRVYDAGDFNAEISMLSLVDGANTVQLVATDTLGNASTVDVAVQFDATSVWPGTTLVDWSMAANPQSAVSIVDGQWVITPDGLRTAQIGYDRTFGLGDLTWDDYEVTVSVIFHGLDTDPFNPSISGTPAFGMTSRWIGHSRRATTEQPRTNWRPQGGGPWYEPEFDRLRLIGWDGMLVDDPADREMQIGVRYFWKLRVETLPDGITSVYRMKMWEDGQQEPAVWEITGTEGVNDLRRGSLLFIAHHCDITVGNVSVTALDDIVSTPQPSTVEYIPSVHGVTALWTTPDLTLGELQLGTTPGGSELGTIGQPGFSEGHRMVFTGLSPATTYYARTITTSIDGQEVVTPEVQFQTLPAGEPPLATDLFDAPSLDPSIWSFIDFFGSATASLDGSGNLILSLPDDASRLGMTGVRLTRPTEDVDFHIEAEFDTPLSTATQMYGFVIEQDADDFVLFDLRIRPGGYEVVIETVIADDPIVVVQEDIDDPQLTALTVPIRLRLDRTRDHWAFAYSIAGGPFTLLGEIDHRLAARRIGLMSGNQNNQFDVTVSEFVVAAADTVAPQISGLRTVVGSHAARLFWNTDEPTDALVRYRAVGAPDFAQTGLGELRNQHEIVIDGLIPDTDYEVQVISSDSVGFFDMVTLNPLTSASLGNRSGLVSDRFETGSLDLSLWRVDDPIGGAVVGEVNGDLSIAQSGPVRDLFTNDTSATRVLQDCIDDDLNVQLRLNSDLTTPIQSQGLVFVHDLATNNFVRVEVQRRSAGLRVFAASVFRGRGNVMVSFDIPEPLALPHWLRVSRVGDTWTVYFSEDGFNFDLAGAFVQPMQVRSVGIYGIHSDGIGHTVLVDEFENVADPLPDTKPPLISGVTVGANDSFVEVSWNTDEPADAEIEIGTDPSLGTLAMRTSLQIAHDLELSGLLPDTMYYLQVRSTDPSGNSSVTPLQTFVTARAGNASGLRTDLFEDPIASSSLWSFVDPTGDGSVLFNGTEAEIGLTGAVAHDGFTGANTFARLVQPVFDEDFEATVRFESMLDTPIQVQGLYVEETASKFLRIEFNRVSGGLRFFAATIDNGSATILTNTTVTSTGPLMLRVTRVGDQWTLHYSANGTSFVAGPSFPWIADVARVGMHAGNSNGVALTSRIGEFLSGADLPPDTTPPVLTDVAVLASGDRVSVQWTTDEPTDGAIEVGTDPSLGTLAMTSTPSTDHDLTLFGLLPETMYYLQVRSTDAAGNTTMLPLQTFVTAKVENTSGLRTDLFDDPTASNSLWSFHDPAGDGALTFDGSAAELALSGAVGHDGGFGQPNTLARFTQPVFDEDLGATLHLESPLSQSIQAQGLYAAESNSKFLRVEFNRVSSGGRLFVATVDGASSSIEANLSLPLNPPVALRFDRTGDQWTIDYSLNGTTFVQAVSFSWAANLTEVGVFAANSVGTPFTLRADEFIASDDLPPDVTPPGLSNVEVLAADDRARVRFSTDEMAIAEIEVGTTMALGTIVSEPGLVLEHELDVLGLIPDTTYFLQIRAMDAVGNPIQLPIQTFETTPFGNASGLRSDTFANASYSSSLWQLVDPQANAVVNYSGSTATFSADGTVLHDVFSGPNTLARHVQPCFDTDFEVETTFSSSSFQNIHGQGLVVEEDDSTLVRAEFHYVGGPRVFVMTIDNGAPSVRGFVDIPVEIPAVLRIARVGDDWTVSYRLDDNPEQVLAQFNFAMEARRVGHHLINLPGTPVTARVEGFRVVPPAGTDAADPTIERLRTVVGDLTAAVRWETDEPATSAVEIGTSTGNYTAMFQGATLGAEAQSHSVPLSGLQPDTTYFWRATSTDPAGNTIVTAESTFTTTSLGFESGVVADGFNGGLATAAGWQWVDPYGRATLSTNPATVALGLPGGVVHDAFSSGVFLPRLRQDMLDTDLDVSTRFTLASTGDFTFHGFGFETADGGYLRIEVLREPSQVDLLAMYVNGPAVQVFALQPVSISYPFDLRVERTGDSFTVSTAPDGATWTPRTTFNLAVDLDGMDLHLGNLLATSHLVLVDSLDVRSTN